LNGKRLAKLKMIRLLVLLFPLLTGVSNCNKDKNNDQITETSLPIERIKLPEGFKISVFAENVKGARSMCLGAKGTLFVGTRDGNVYALIDADKDNKAEKMYTLAKDMNSPNGVAFRDGSLYIAEIHQVRRFDNIESNLEKLPEGVLINNQFAVHEHHGWKYIAFGPDGKLYLPVGAPCNVCDKDAEGFSNLMRMNPDGSGLEVYARGIRNTVGFAWHPETKELWFTDNGRDMMGDDIPPDELNYAPKSGMHFGFPFCQGGDIPDPEYGAGHSCSEFTPPAQKLGPHVAALGMKFYTGTKFPAKYHNAIFIAEHGSWNRSTKIGYRVMMVRLDGNKAVSYEPFAEGWLNGSDVWGRPVDILIMPDGSMLVSDDHAGAIYRITYGE
jgi:glucose/arabinose dehydrogenase